MDKKNFGKIVIFILIFVGLQTYFQDNSSFRLLIGKWKGYFVPLIWAIFMSVLLSPVVEYFEKKLKISRLLSLILSISLIILLFVGILFLVIPELITSVSELNEIFPHIVEKSTKLSEKVVAYLSEKNIFVFDENEMVRDTGNFIKNNLGNIQKIIVSILKNVVWWTIGLANFIMGLVLASLILLNEKAKIATRDNLITIIFGFKNKNYVIEKINVSVDIFKSYMIGRMIVSFVVGLSVFVVLILTKTPYAALSAIILGFGNMIPYVGTLIAGTIAVFLVLIVAPVKVLFLIFAIALAQFLDNFVIGPKIVADKVGLSTFWVMVAMLVFGGLFGLTGMVLGVPIMCIIKLFYFDLLERAKNKEKQ